MRKDSRIFLSVVFCVLLLLLAALIFQARRSTGAVKQSTPITFANQTTSVQISNIEQSDRGVKLIAKNVGALPLVVLNFDIAGGHNINVDFTTHEALNGQLDTGKSEPIFLRVRPLPDSGKVTLKMAFFIDGSSEGDQDLAERQRDIFSAMDSVFQSAKIEIHKISTFDPVALENAKSRINNLSEPSNLTEGQQIGFKSGKDRAAGSIDKLLEDASMLSNENREERFAKLKNKFDKALPSVDRRKND